VKSVGDGTDVSFNYAVGGYAKDGFDDWSKKADHMLSDQIERYKKLVESPSPPR
jgi:hypothetical protein